MCNIVHLLVMTESVNEVHQIFTLLWAYLHASMQFTSISWYIQLFMHVATNHTRINEYVGYH